MLLNILLVASEAIPLAKSGGLGDAVSAMARALRQAGADATLLLPGYPQALEGATNLHPVAQLDDLPGGTATLMAGHIPDFDVPVLLLRNDALYNRAGGLYMDADGNEFPDNAIRFAALAHAATRIAGGRTPLPAPHVVHLHDWHAALTPLLMRAAGISTVRTVLTLHNLAFQGSFPIEQAAALKIPEHLLTQDAMVQHGRINFLKAGIRHADHITAVSHTYAREILTPQFGCGLDDLLQSRRHVLSAIPNGVDADTWNPAVDPFLHAPYDALDMHGKRDCKRTLQAHFGLDAAPDAPLIALCSRLTTQKMGDLAAEALPGLLDRHPTLQVAILGCGDRHIEQALLAVAHRYPGRCVTRIGYNERDAHRLQAGADMLLHGSRFEPFGLTPIYAMRYGTIPIGTRVGGMADTITDPGADANPNALRTATGILFEGETAEAMAAAVERALALRTQPALWRAMQRNGMQADFGWSAPVARYVGIYRTLAAQTSAVPATLRPAPALVPVDTAVAQRAARVLHNTTPAVPAPIAAQAGPGGSTIRTRPATGGPLRPAPAVAGNR